MLSPYKLYKLDKPLARAIVPDHSGIHPTYSLNPEHPGGPCYTHYNIDWTVHRLYPAIMQRQGKKGQRIVSAPAVRLARKQYRSAFKSDPVGATRDTSPRWGSDRGKHTTFPIPKEGVEVSAKTVAGAGVATGGVVGYKSHNKLQAGFQKGFNYSKPKYKSKIKKATYTQYKY